MDRKPSTNSRFGFRLPLIFRKEKIWNVINRWFAVVCCDMAATDGAARRDGVGVAAFWVCRSFGALQWLLNELEITEKLYEGLLRPQLPLSHPRKMLSALLSAALSQQLFSRSRDLFSRDP